MFEWLRAIVTLAGRLTTLETQVQRTIKKMDNLELDFTQALADIDAETNRIAAVLEDLKAQITGQGIPAAKEAEILALLSAQVTKLKGVGAAPAPVPVPVPTPVPTPEPVPAPPVVDTDPE